MEKLHPGARWAFRFRAYYSFFIVGIFLYLWGLGSLGIFFSFSLNTNILFLIIYFFVALFITEIYATMAYNRFLYEISDNGVKIEQGVVWKKYTSIPYERVQNVDIKRGIIARMFGFSSVDIETAGRSGGYARYGRRRGQYRSEGHLPALGPNHAEQVREFVLKKIKSSHKDKSGL